MAMVDTLRTRAPQSLGAAAWVVTVPLAGAAAARMARYDRHPILAMANAGTPFVYLPAWGAMAVGAFTGRRALTAVAAGVAGAHLVWTVPELRRRPPLPGDAAAGDAPRLRVVSSNVRFPSSDSTPLGVELAASGADVLLLQELSPEHLSTIKAAGAFDTFPSSYVDTRAGSFGAGIWSRYPIIDGETWEPAGLPMVRATIDVEGTHVTVFNVHCKAPMRRRWISPWRTQLAELAREAREARTHGPVIVAGDFNATYGHQPFRDLLRTGLRDAHVEVGRGLATTWPRGGRVIPPLFRLDHVLVSDGIAVLDAREGVGLTSDHRPVIADLAVLPQRG